MKKRIAILIFLPVLAICFALAGCGEKQPSATDIYNQCIYNVVEVKAVSENVGESFGTAEIISKDGRLVTNAHVVTYTRLNVVTEFENYYIRFSFEDEYREVTLEKFDSERDIAFLKLKDTAGLDIKPVNIGNSDSLKAGQRVYAVGNASNYGIGIFEGIVSIPLINIELDGVLRSVIQCDLTIAAGNSGGALLNGSGEFVGITTFRTKDNSGNVIFGIVYCIPVNTVLEFLNAA
ncbi:MAG: serine protease [Roseburia sp.]|nr:serine protease [Roseburia sp.]